MNFISVCLFVSSLYCLNTNFLQVDKKTNVSNRNSKRKLRLINVSQMCQIDAYNIHGNRFNKKIPTTEDCVSDKRNESIASFYLEIFFFLFLFTTKN